MRTVMTAIKIHQQGHARLPLFERMRHGSLSPWQRLAFHPCVAHFALGFADLNRYVLRQDHSQNAHQALVNEYGNRGDERLAGVGAALSLLGFEVPGRPSELVQMLWSEEMSFNRALVYRLTTLITHASPRQRLALLAAIDGATVELFSLLWSLIRQIAELTGISLAGKDLDPPSRGVGLFGGVDQQVLSEVSLPAGERLLTLEQVDEVFSLFRGWTAELLRYATTHPLHVPMRLEGDPALFEYSFCA